MAGQQQQRGKSVFAGNPFANRKSPILMRVLLKKLRREGGLKDGLETESKPGEQFQVAPGAVDHGKASGASNALMFHNWSGDKPDTEEQ